jgi:hypothetical protein
MAAVLTYYPRRGVLEAVVAGRVFKLPTYGDAERIAEWEHRFEFRPGKYAVWDHCFEFRQQHVGSNAGAMRSVSSGGSALGGYDYPGYYAQRFDGVDKGGGAAPHSHAGTNVYVGGRGGGAFLHGWPVCNLNSCIIVMQRWEELRRAVVGETEFSFTVSIG